MSSERVQSKIGEPNPPGEISLPSNISLHFFLSPHNDLEDLGDLEEFKKRVLQADIVVPEMSGWEEEALGVVRRIAKGDYKEYTFRKNLIGTKAFEYGIFSALYGSKKEVILLDLHEKDPLFTKIMKSMAPNKDEDYFGADIEKAIAHENAYMEEFIALDAQREEYIVNTVGPALERFIKDRPKLSEKHPVRVLMILGAAHITLAQRLQKIAEQQRELDNSDYPVVTIEEKKKEESEHDFLLTNHYKGINILPHEQLRELLIRKLMRKTIRSLASGSGIERSSKVVSACIDEVLTMDDLVIVFDYLNAGVKSDLETRKSKKEEYESIKDRIFTYLRERSA